MKAEIKIPKNWKRLKTGTKGTRKGDRLFTQNLDWEYLDEDDADIVTDDEIVIRKIKVKK